MKPDTTSEGLPTYAESTSSNSVSPATLPQSVATARATLIALLLRTQITPHLHRAALSGLSSTTLLFVPSNVTTLRPPIGSFSKIPSGLNDDFPGEKVVGFPSADNPTISRLQGQENSLEFWRQPAVILELEKQLRTQLRSEGYRLVGDESERVRASNAEWRTVEKEHLRDGEARTAVEIKEICLRVENEMGLFETKTGKAVVVRVDIGE
ncbi:hypothetical protein MMC28_004964 [Mycoblastus sanguinarius]|nr:hypothetical protein [Mycoblastus sanguinarius]